MTKGCLYLLVTICLNFGCNTNQDLKAKNKVSLKEAYKDYFLIGAALNTNHIFERDSSALKVIDRHINSIVPENCMKSMYIQPQQDKFFFDEADAFVNFGEERDMYIIGHTLIWHSQTPDWLFVNDDGTDVSKDELIKRMRNHISTLVGRYKGRVNGWDVVNEAILDDGSYRESKFYEIIGKDFIKLAFQFAHEADPGAKLYYNDYSMSNEGKRNGVVRMVKELQDEGVRIDGIGMQGHGHLNYPELSDFEASIEAFSALGVNVMITEMDISVLPSPWNVSADIAASEEFKAGLNPYTGGLPDSISTTFSNRYTEFFKLFIKHKDNIERVTFWGVDDGHSWKNNFPVRGRTDYPLLFDRNYEAKPVVESLIKLVATDINPLNLI